MMVAGVVRSMTAESAERAALGAGAIVMDVIASNDKRLPHQQIERIRHLRPDMILLSGGIDGGTTTHVVEIAELVSAAAPTPPRGAGEPHTGKNCRHKKTPRGRRCRTKSTFGRSTISGRFWSWRTSARLVTRFTNSSWNT